MNRSVRIYVGKIECDNHEEIIDTQIADYILTNVKPIIPSFVTIKAVDGRPRKLNIWQIKKIQIL